MSTLFKIRTTEMIYFSLKKFKFRISFVNRKVQYKLYRQNNILNILQRELIQIAQKNKIFHSGH